MNEHPFGLCYRLFQALLVATGVAVIFTIPGVGFLFGMLVVSMLALGLCFALARGGLLLRLQSWASGWEHAPKIRSLAGSDLHARH